MNHPVKKEQCAHGKSLDKPCSQCNEAWKDMTSPRPDGWEEQFDETDFGFVMSAKAKRNIKSFIRQELTTQHHKDIEAFRGMVRKQVQGEFTEINGEDFVSVSTREQKAVNQALSNIEHALSTFASTDTKTLKERGIYAKNNNVK